MEPGKIRLEPKELNLENLYKIVRIQSTTHALNFMIVKENNIMKGDLLLFIKDKDTDNIIKTGGYEISTDWEDYLKKESEMFSMLALTTGIVDSEEVIGIENIEEGTDKSLRKANIMVKQVDLYDMDVNEKIKKIKESGLFNVTEEKNN